MKRRLKLAMSLLLATLMLAGPVAAHDFTGSEERKNSRGKTVYTNNVRCNRKATADAGGVKVYHSQTGTTSGGIGVCNDGTGPLGSVAPIQGRAVAKGSTSGGAVYADGDRNNPNEQSQGFARADGKFNGTAPTVRCGDPKGRKDATHPTPADKQDDCG